MADLSKLVDELSTLTVLEAADLAKMLEEKWGVSAAAAVAVAGPAAAAAAPAEEKTEFTVMLMAAGEKKIEVIKEVRALDAYLSEIPGQAKRDPGIEREIDRDGGMARRHGLAYRAHNGPGQDKHENVCQFRSLSRGIATIAAIAGGIRRLKTIRAFTVR